MATSRFSNTATFGAVSWLCRSVAFATMTATDFIVRAVYRAWTLSVRVATWLYEGLKPAVEPLLPEFVKAQYRQYKVSSLFQRRIYKEQDFFFS